MLLKEKLKSFGLAIATISFLGLLLWSAIDDYFGSKPLTDAQKEIEYQEELIFNQGFEAGYEAGRYDGLEDAAFDINDFSFYDYPELLEDAAVRLEEAASDYALDCSGWSPEEAMVVIECYECQKAYHQNGSPPTYEEYRESLLSLYCFFDYFYNRQYE